MNNIIRTLLQLKFVSHFYHHTINGPNFLQNHEFLGDLYKQYDDWYDDTVERSIGLNLTVDFVDIHTTAVSYFQECTKKEDWVSVLLYLNEYLLSLIEDYVKTNPSQGTIQLLGDIANEVEVFNFKLKGIR
jgi:DNA-binding ferritin-like protein